MIPPTSGFADRRGPRQTFPTGRTCRRCRRQDRICGPRRVPACRRERAQHCAACRTRRRLSLGSGELPEEVLVDTSEHVASLAVVAFKADIGNEVDETFHLQRLNAATGIIAREFALEVRVVPLDGQDRIVDQRGDVRACS